MKNIAQKDIAVIGVSSKETKFGYRIFKDLLKNGFKVHGINPVGGRILGKDIYRDLSQLGLVPEVVITVVPPVVTERIVRECVRMGVRLVWMQPGSESANAIKTAEDAGLKVVSGKCFMKEVGIW